MIKDSINHKFKENMHFVAHHKKGKGCSEQSVTDVWNLKISILSAQEKLKISSRKEETRMEWFSYLLFLVCPLMMLFMMRGGHGGGHSHSEHDHEMHNRLQNLEEENQRLKERLNAFSDYTDQKKTS
ncbi:MULTISPECIES: DUF2933 domain-containing protein [Heyndrickxia]|jgi:hypothetical protein